MVHNRAIILTLFLSPLCFAEENPATDPLTKEITDLSAAIRLHSDDPQGYRARAEFFHWRGEQCRSLSYVGKLPCDAYKKDYRRAIADYSQAMRLNPGDTIDYQERATLYLALRDYKKAIADCTEALRMQPGNDKAYQIRLIAYRNQGDYDRAIADCTAYIQLDPANPSRQMWWSERGLLHEAKGDYKHALEDFTKTIRLVPGNPVSYENRGDYFLRRRMYDNALADYGKAIRIAQKMPSLECWIGDMHGRRAWVYLCKREFDAAMMEYTKAIEYHPSEGDHYAWRAMFHLFRGKGRRFLADCQKAIECYRDRPRRRAVRTLLLAVLGNFRQAIDDYGPRRETGIPSLNYMGGMGGMSGTSRP